MATTSTSLQSRVSVNRRIKDNSFTTFLSISIVASLAFIFYIIYRLYNNAGYLLSWDLIRFFPSYDIDTAGFQAPIMGSIWVVGFASLFAIPIGVMTAL